MWGSDDAFSAGNAKQLQQDLMEQVELSGDTTLGAVQGELEAEIMETRNAFKIEFGEWILEGEAEQRDRYLYAQYRLFQLWKQVASSAVPVASPPVFGSGGSGVATALPARDVQVDLQLATEAWFTYANGQGRYPLTDAQDPSPTDQNFAIKMVGNRYQRSMYISLSFGFLRDFGWVTPLVSPPVFGASTGNWLKFYVAGQPPTGWLTDPTAWVVQWTYFPQAYELFAGLNPAIVSSLLVSPGPGDKYTVTTNKGATKAVWDVFAMRYLAQELYSRRPDLRPDLVFQAVRDAFTGVGGAWWLL